MRILAIETVGTTGSVALLEAASVVEQVPLDPALRSAQSLAPGIAELLRGAGWRPSDVELVAVATGPGSFTGLRIGVTTAKTFAFACGGQVLGVHTMSAVAWRAPPEVEQLSVLVDAQRNELFVAEFTRDAGSLVGQDSTRIVDAGQWIESLRSGQIVTGPALTRWATQLPTGVVPLDANLWNPTAAAVGQLAARDFAAGRREGVFDLVPQYFRRTAAEEQWERKADGLTRQ